MKSHLLAAATAAALLGLTSPTFAQTAPTGVWIDHTGRGAVEITECGPNLCGRLVWLKDAKDQSACGTQILGNVKPVSAGVWDKGWIFDPEQNSRYDVELKPMAGDKLRVLGYMGSKFLSETMIWKRAPDNLQRCGAEPARQAAVNPPPAPAASGPASPPPAAKAPSEPAPAPSANPPLEARPAPSEQADAGPFASDPEPEEKPAAKGKRRTAQKECRLDLPYIKVTYPCID